MAKFESPQNIKYRRMVFRMINEADLVLEVLDARFPHLTRSTEIEEYARQKQKKILFIVNKADLVPLEINKQWKKIFEKEGYNTVFISAQKRQGTSILRKAIKENAPYFPCKICVMGIPNTGKSSMINILKGRHSAPTSSFPGWTKSVMWVRIDPEILLIDTPGVNPLETEEQESLRAFLGTHPPEQLENPQEEAKRVLERILRHKSDGFADYFGVDPYLPFSDILVMIAQKRGKIRSIKKRKKRGWDMEDADDIEERYDLDEAARIIIREFAKGKFSYYESPKRIYNSSSENPSNS
ncbi:MAG: GTPase [Promethearchaeota archaeon]